MTPKTLISHMIGLIVSLLVVAACSAAQPTLPPTSTPSPLSVAESLVNQYVSAYETKNADLYLSLFSEDGVYVDYGINLEPTPLVYLREDVYSTFADTHFQFEITSYFVSADGRFAAIEGIYTDWPRGANQTASVPCLAILEIRDGRIVKESFYYNGAEF